MKSSQIEVSNTDSESGYDSDTRKSFDDYKLETCTNDTKKINYELKDDTSVKNEDKMRDQNETFNIDD